LKTLEFIKITKSKKLSDTPKRRVLQPCDKGLKKINPYKQTLIIEIKA
tara:strand:+ start:400 stop:543 length:144 start_codon:yes stop_codon:yes gene_type:complete